METVRDDAAKLDRLLRRTEAAKYVTNTYGIPCSPKTLAKLACVSSEGPPFRLAGRFPGIAPCSVELYEAVVAVNDVKQPSQFGQERDCWSPFRSERPARPAGQEVDCRL